MMHNSATATNARRQRGSMAVTMMLLMVGLIAILGLVEVAYVFWAKRDAQKVADLAALAGAQSIASCTADNGDNSASRANIAQNRFAAGNANTATVVCGVWDPTAAPAGGGGAPADHFYSTDAATPKPNAVKVVATRPFVPFFGFVRSMNISAEAVATQSFPMAGFSVGSSLLDLNACNSALLGPLLCTLLDSKLGLSVLSSDGVANADVSLLQVLKLANVDVSAATVDDVANAKVDALTLLTAEVDALNQSNSNVASVDVGALKALIAQLDVGLLQAQVKLGDVLGLNAGTANPANALDLDANLADLIQATLQVANQNHAVELANANGSPLVNLAGLGTVADVKLAIVEPAQVAFGLPRTYLPAGTAPTEAHTAQTRLGVGLQLLNLPGSGNNILDIHDPANLVRIQLGTNSGSAGVVSLPVNVEVSQASATLEDIKCNVGSPLRHEVTLSAQPGVASVFIGNTGIDLYANTSSDWRTLVTAAINNGTAYADLVSLKLTVSALASLIQVTGTVKVQAYAYVPAEPPQATSFTFDVDPSTPVIDQNLQHSVNSNSDVLASVGNALGLDGSPNISLRIKDSDVSINLLGLPISLSPLLGVLDTAINTLLNGDKNNGIPGLLGVLGTVLNPVLNVLDDYLLGPLLDLLGIDLANAKVHLTDVQCHSSAQLVY